MRKHEKRLKCTLLHGTFDIFFGIEHSLRKEEMKEHLNKEAKEGWRFAADAARITDERASSEDQKQHNRTCFCDSGQQSGSSCWREKKEQ